MLDSETGEALACKALYPDRNPEPRVLFRGCDFAGRAVVPFAMCNPPPPPSY